MTATEEAQLVEGYTVGYDILALLYSSLRTILELWVPAIWVGKLVGYEVLLCGGDVWTFVPGIFGTG